MWDKLSKQLKRLSEQLKRLNEFCPSTEQKEEMHKKIDEIINNLTGFKDKLSSLPDNEEISKVINSIDTLIQFMEKVKNNTALAITLDIRSKKNRQNKQSKDVSEIVNSLNSLSNEEILRQLLQFDKSTLLSIAKFMKIGVNKRANKEGIADRIWKVGFVNLRGGYKIFRQQTNGKL